MKGNNMKKSIMIMVASIMLVMIGMVAGCYTSATAYTKNTLPDGTVVESNVKIIGTGDKASQIAAEGMFADGTVEDLGAGFKNANASQESTGIQGTLAGMGTLMTGMAEFMKAAQQVNPATIAVPSISTPAPATSKQEVSVEAAANPQPLSQNNIKGQNVVNANSNAEIVILGNRETCPLCRTLWSKLDVKNLSSAACDASVIDADKTDNASVYAAKRPTVGFEYPYVRIYVAGNLADEFSARGLSQAQIAERAKKAIGECSVPSE